MLVAPARLGDSVHVLSRRAGAIAPALRAIAPVLLDKDATDGIGVSENTLVLDSSVNRGRPQSLVTKKEQNEEAPKVCAICEKSYSLVEAENPSQSICGHPIGDGGSQWCNRLLLGVD
jgi:hypothetical protein